MCLLHPAIFFMIISLSYILGLLTYSIIRSYDDLFSFKYVLLYLKLKFIGYEIITNNWNFSDSLKLYSIDRTYWNFENDEVSTQSYYFIGEDRNHIYVCDNWRCDEYSNKIIIKKITDEYFKIKNISLKDRMHLEMENEKELKFNSLIEVQEKLNY